MEEMNMNQEEQNIWHHTKTETLEAYVKIASDLPAAYFEIPENAKNYYEARMELKIRWGA